jgi:hypothetical protein
MLCGCAYQAPATHPTALIDSQVQRDSRQQRISSVQGTRSAAYSSAYSPCVYDSNGFGAAALAFDPPVLAGSTRVDLSRDGRESAAFFGYQESSTTFSFVRVENVQRDRDDRTGYERDSISETYGVISR